jgi:hypothetical protein
MRYWSKIPSFETPPSGAPQDDAETVETTVVMVRSGAKPRDRNGDAGVSNHAGRRPRLLT